MNTLRIARTAILAFEVLHTGSNAAKDIQDDWREWDRRTNGWLTHTFSGAFGYAVDCVAKRPWWSQSLVEVLFIFTQTVVRRQHTFGLNSLGA